jgi:pimeloyl-ACP methyl ester carboxylesterase
MPESARQKLAQRMPKVRSEFEALFADDVPLSAYRRLGMPVCLIGGGRSPLPARRVSERLLSVLPRGRHVVLQKLDHMGPVNRPAEFFAALPAWLKPAEQAEAA